VALPTSAPNTVTSLNGLFKTIYADKLLPLVPEFAVIQKLVDFVPADKEQGNYYSQPVVLSSEAGVTYLGTSGSTATLNNPLAGVMKEAQVYGSEFNLRAQLSYLSLTRAAEKGVRAFERASKFKVEDMNSAARKRIEIGILYGQSGIGTVSTSTYDSSTYTNVVLTDASWAGGIWAGMEGAMLDSWNGTSLRNAASTPLVIAKVNSSAKTLSFLGDKTASIAAGDVIFFYNARTGASTYNEMAGLQAILSASSSIFNIDPSVYSLWAGNTFSSAGPLSLAKMQKWIAAAVNKGLMDKVAAFVSPTGWASMLSNEAALRVYDKSYSPSRMENGAEALRFHSQNGLVEVYSHPMVKDGDAFVVPIEDLLRLGSTDLTFGRPGVDGEDVVYFDRVPNTNALELQVMCDQAIFLPKPAHGVYVSGITYS
jgi:hypothetical protein